MRIEMTNKKPEALIFADDRPSEIGDDLYQWANDAEDMIRSQHARIVELETQLAIAQQEVQEANECRVTLITQIHELVDHIERAASCVPDSDMRKQMLGQRDFASKVATEWNKNGNPFVATKQEEQLTNHKKH